MAPKLIFNSKAENQYRYISANTDFSLSTKEVKSIFRPEVLDKSYFRTWKDVREWSEGNYDTENQKKEFIKCATQRFSPEAQLLFAKVSKPMIEEVCENGIEIQLGLNPQLIWLNNRIKTQCASLFKYKEYPDHEKLTYRSTEGSLLLSQQNTESILFSAKLNGYDLFRHFYDLTYKQATDNFDDFNLFLKKTGNSLHPITDFQKTAFSEDTGLAVKLYFWMKNPHAKPLIDILEKLDIRTPKQAAVLTSRYKNHLLLLEQTCTNSVDTPTQAELDVWSDVALELQNAFSTFISSYIQFRGEILTLEQNMSEDTQSASLKVMCNKIQVDMPNQTQTSSTNSSAEQSPNNTPIIKVDGYDVLDYSPCDETEFDDNI